MARPLEGICPMNGAVATELSWAQAARTIILASLVSYSPHKSGFVARQTFPVSHQRGRSLSPRNRPFRALFGPQKEGWYVMYYTTGAWIQAFLRAMNELLTARSGIMSRHGLRFRALACDKHPDCVMVELDHHQEHVPYKEHEPGYAARSLRDHYRRRTTFGGSR